MSHLEIKKMKQGMSYSCKEKTIILNVFKYFRLQFPDKCVTEIVRNTAKATGCSEKSIFQFRKEEASVEGFREPSKTKIRKNLNINSRDIKYGDTVRQAIRNIVYDLKYRNIVPSLNTILKQVKSDSQMPNFSLMTLRRLLFDMGFCYEKNGNKSILVEKSDSKSNKECIPLKDIRKPPIQAQTANVNININNTSKEILEAKQNIPPAPKYTPHVVNNEQARFAQMSQPDSQIISPMHNTHNIPMMINPHREIMPPLHTMPSNMNSHIKHELLPWIESYNHNMIMQQQLC